MEEGWLTLLIVTARVNRFGLGRLGLAQESHVKATFLFWTKKEITLSRLMRVFPLEQGNEMSCLTEWAWLNEKQEQLKSSSQTSLTTFCPLSRTRSSSITPISFQASLEAWKWRRILAKSLFCTNKVGILPCENAKLQAGLNRKNFRCYLIKPVNQVIKTERIRISGTVPKQGLKEVSSRFLLSEQAGKCIPTLQFSAQRSHREPQSEVSFLLDQR